MFKRNRLKKALQELKELDELEKTQGKATVVKESICKDWYDALSCDYKRPWWDKIWLRIKWKLEAISIFFERSYQKLKYGFPLWEGYSFVYWHRAAVVPRLKYLRNNLHGFPMAILTDEECEAMRNRDHKNGDWAEFEKEDDIFDKRWKDILDKIIWAFEHMEDHIEPVYPYDYDHRYKKIEYSDGSVGFMGLDERSPDFSQQEEHDKKVREGLGLFAKHYFSLCD